MQRLILAIGSSAPLRGPPAPRRSGWRAQKARRSRRPTGSQPHARAAPTANSMHRSWRPIQVEREQQLSRPQTNRLRYEHRRVGGSICPLDVGNCDGDLLQADAPCWAFGPVSPSVETSFPRGASMSSLGGHPLCCPDATRVDSCRCSSCDGSESQSAFARPDQLLLARPSAASTQHRLS